MEPIKWKNDHRSIFDCATRVCCSLVDVFMEKKKNLELPNL